MNRYEKKILVLASLTMTLKYFSSFLEGIKIKPLYVIILKFKRIAPIIFQQQNKPYKQTQKVTVQSYTLCGNLNTNRNMGLTIKNVTEDELMVEEASNKAHNTLGYEQNRTRTAIH